PRPLGGAIRQERESAATRGRQTSSLVEPSRRHWAEEKAVLLRSSRSPRGRRTGEPTACSWVTSRNAARIERPAYKQLLCRGLGKGNVQAPLAGDALERVLPAVFEGQPGAGDQILDRARNGGAGRAPRRRGRLE